MVPISIRLVHDNVDTDMSELASSGGVLRRLSFTWVASSML